MDEETKETPEWAAQGFESEQAYLDARKKQASEEAHSRLNRVAEPPLTNAVDRTVINDNGHE